MRASFWKYENDTFRGKVIKYHGHRIEEITCDEVRRNKLRAIEDAEKLIAKLKKESKL